MSQPSHRLLLAFSMLAGLGMRVAYLADRPIWYDEAFSILLARRSLPEILAGTAADTMPPLYYLLLKAWMVLGTSIAYLRMLNVLLGIGLILLAFALGRALISESAGAWCALLVASSPFLIFHAQELRMYTLLAVTLAAYVLATYRLLISPSRSYQAAVALSAAAALYTHNLASFTLLAPNLLLIARRDWKRLRDLLVSQSVAAVIFLPWLMVVPGQIAKIQSAFWTPLPGFLEIVQALVTLHTNLPLPDALIPVALFGTLLTLTLVTYGLIKLRAEWPIGYLLVFALAPPAALGVVSFLMRPLFVSRAFIFSLVAYIVIIAWLIVRPPLRGFRFAILFSFLAPALVSLPSFYTFESFPRSPFASAGDRLVEHAAAGERIIHDNKLSFFPMVVYEPELAMVFLADEPGSHNDTLAAESAHALGLTPLVSIEQAVDGAVGIWFVVFQRAIDEYAEQGLPDHPRVAWLDNHYSRLEEIRIGDLWLFHYGLAEQACARSMKDPVCKDPGPRFPGGFLIQRDSRARQ